MTCAHKAAAPAFEKKTWFMQMLALCFLAIGLPANAAERSQADFVKACLSSSNLSKEVCECSAKKAKGELSPDGFALLVAMHEKNNEVSASLRSTLPIDQTMKAGTFMARAPAQCAKESARN